MGQRSQIYVRFPMVGEKGRGYGLIANYYQWNYGERMISRLRYALEYIRDAHLQDYLEWYFNVDQHYEHFRRYLDVNFDMKDMVLSTDIIQDYIKYGHICASNVDITLDRVFNDYVFDWQDNNDGKLLIDISKLGVKYAFLRERANETDIMDADGYMEWDCGVKWKSKETLDVSTCIGNIEAISKLAKLMTEEEVKDFLNCEYVNEPVVS